MEFGKTGVRVLVKLPHRQIALIFYFLIFYILNETIMTPHYGRWTKRTSASPFIMKSNALDFIFLGLHRFLNLLKFKNCTSVAWHLHNLLHSEKLSYKLLRVQPVYFVCFSQELLWQCHNIHSFLKLQQGCGRKTLFPPLRGELQVLKVILVYEDRIVKYAVHALNR